MFVSLACVYLAVMLPWPIPWEIAYDKGDLYGLRYGFPLPVFETSLISLDPPYPYPLRSMGPPDGVDPLEMFWTSLAANVVFFFAVYLLLIKLLVKVSIWVKED